MEDYLNGIDEDPWCCISSGNRLIERREQCRMVGATPDVVLETDKQKANEKRCLRERCGAFPPVPYNYVRSCKQQRRSGIL